MISSTNTSLKFLFTWYKYYYLTFSYVKLKGALKQLKNFFIGIFINDNPNRKEFDNFLEKFSQDQQNFKISKKKWLKNYLDSTKKNDIDLGAQGAHLGPKRGPETRNVNRL